jgi:2-polyprenyl-6-methoxyphenol hydroxylase-like FAD-dependent oxidoreductase
MRKVIKERIRRRARGLDLAADINAVIAVNDGREKQTVSEEQGFKPITREELNAMAGEELPERAAMSLINANVAIPINAAVAANVLSDGAVAYADAAQTTPIDQSN